MEKTTKIRTGQSKIGVIDVSIEGITPLVVHAKSAKMQREFMEKYGTKLDITEEEKQAMGVKGDDAQTPHEQYRGALYFMPGTEDTKKEAYGIPAVGFKCAMGSIGAIYWNKLGAKGGISKAGIKRAIQILDDGGGLVKIKTKSGPKMRQDWVKVGNGKSATPALRFRPEFKDWACKLRIQFDMDQYKAAELLHILEAAGLTIGWGELRPELGAGSCGMWKIKGNAKITQISG